MKIEIREVKLPLLIPSPILSPSSTLSVGEYLDQSIPCAVQDRPIRVDPHIEVLTSSVITQITFEERIRKPHVIDEVHGQSDAGMVH